MPKMAAIAASDDFLASHIGQLLVRQPQPKASEPVQPSSEARRSITSTTTASVSDDSTARAKSTTSASQTVTCGHDSGDSSASAGKTASQSALLDDDAAEKLTSLSLQAHTRERTSSTRSSFATNFGAPARRISISNARCSSIASETTSYFEHRRRRSMRSSHHSQISSPGFSPAYSAESSAIKWNMPFGNDESAFATAVQQNTSKMTRHSCSDAVDTRDNDAMAQAAKQHKSSSFSGPYGPQQRRQLANMHSPKLDSSPLHSPPLSICSSADAGPSAHSVKSGSSFRSHRRGPALIPNANDARTFTFVELSSDSEQSDYSPVSTSPNVPSQSSSSPEPASISASSGISPFTAIVDLDSTPKPIDPTPAPSTSPSSVIDKDNGSRSVRTVKFAAPSQPAVASAPLVVGTRVGRTRQITILPKDPRKPTLLERTMAKERTRRQNSAEQIVRMNDRARAKSPVIEQPEAKPRESDTSYDPIEYIQGARKYRLRSGTKNDSGQSGSDEDASKNTRGATRSRANSGAQGDAHQPRSNERTNDWAREQTRFTSPPLLPSKAVGIPLPSPDERDVLALPEALTAAQDVPSGKRIPLSNSHSSYSMSSASPPSDMQDLRTPPSETYTALSSPVFELDEPAVTIPGAAKPVLNTLDTPVTTNTLTAAAPAA